MVTQPAPKVPQADLSLIAVTILVVGFLVAGLPAVAWLLGHVTDRPVGTVEITLRLGAFLAFVGAGAVGLVRFGRLR